MSLSPQRSNKMKCKTLGNLLAVALILFSSVVGCKKKTQGITPLPGLGKPAVTPRDTASGPLNNTLPISPGLPDTRTGNIPLPSPSSLAGMVGDNGDTFRAQTVYFDFDKDNIKPGEVSKIEAVAARMKEFPGKAVRVEGHCDERGTEEYNRALGERRALSIREYLVKSGFPADLIDTRSYGEDKPVETGHNEAAWSKNRRGEFILLSPP